MLGKDVIPASLSGTLEGMKSQCSPILVIASEPAEREVRIETERIELDSRPPLEVSGQKTQDEERMASQARNEVRNAGTQLLFQRLCNRHLQVTIVSVLERITPVLK